VHTRWIVRVRSAIGRTLLGIAAGALALPAVSASAATGGATAPSGSPGSAPGTPPASTAGAIVVAPASVMRGQGAIVTGTLPAAGRTVWLQVRSAEHVWMTVASAPAGASGAFTISWLTSRTGELALRVASPVLATRAAVGARSPLSVTPVGDLAVFAPVVATWYGPGFYGNHTACGETLTRQIVGVADRTLPCGTPVSVTYAGRTLTLPVIDRGPYSGAATLDLTSAAAQELGVTETVGVGMLARKGPALAPTDYFAPGTGSTGTTGVTGPTSTAGGATAPPS
jgi:hypothetical protein